MFEEISLCLQEYDSDLMVEEEQEITYETTVINEGTQLRVSIPPKTEVNINIYKINLELYFSNFPFQDLTTFKPKTIANQTIVFEAGEAREEKIARDSSFKDIYVEVIEKGSGGVNSGNQMSKKVNSLMWSNPEVKVKLMEQYGTIQVFYEGRKQSGSYCKVYQKKNSFDKFYRDGYTDITGSFKYALAELEGITEFSILVLTPNGGQIVTAKPPSQQRYI